MTRSVILGRALVWTLIYLAIALSPLSLTKLGDRPGMRSPWIEIGVGFGFVGFAMLAMQFLTTGRFRRVAPFFGSDAEVAFHRASGIATVVLVLAHPVIVIIAKRDNLSYLDPRENLPRAVALTGVVIALILLTVLPLWRRRFGLSYEWWRISHGLLAVVVIGIGMVHAIQVGHYVSGLWKQATWVVAATVPIGLWAHVRLVRPWRLRRRPWRVAEIRFDTSDTFHLVLEAVGHRGMPFQAGQYGWLTLGETPWTLQQHPFSFISSAEQSDRIEFGIKALGDFTGQIPEYPVGSTAFLEGPFGAFTLDPSASGAAFVVGGIGLTPVLSILETCRDRGDRRPFLLINANDRQSDIAFADRLKSLEGDLRLNVVDVIQSPPEDWQGESGFVTEELLNRYVDRLEATDIQYMTCGPEPLMDVVERALIRRGTPQFRIAAERFDLA